MGVVGFTWMDLFFWKATLYEHRKIRLRQRQPYATLHMGVASISILVLARRSLSHHPSLAPFPYLPLLLSPCSLCSSPNESKPTARFSSPSSSSSHVLGAFRRDLVKVKPHQPPPESFFFFRYRRRGSAALPNRRSGVGRDGRKGSC